MVANLSKAGMIMVLTSLLRTQRNAGKAHSHWENPYISELLHCRVVVQPAENQRNNMIRNLAVVMGLTLLFTVQASAQQDPQLTQWFNDPAAFNIGAAGETDLTHVNAWYRNQWMGVNGAPVTTMLNLHTRVDFVPGALGVQLYQDEIGQESNTMVKLGYAYHLSPLSNGAHVGVGLNVSLFSKSFDPDWLAQEGGTQPWLIDAAIPGPGESGTSVDLDFGIFMRKGKEYYAGISATHLAEVQMSSLSIVPTRHFYFMGGYNYPLSGDDLVLRSNVLAKTDLNATAIDLNVNVLYNHFVWGGLSYRHGDAIAPMAGIQYSMSKKEGITESTQVFKLGYSFDATTSELRTYSSGSHEVFLSYCFKFITTPVVNKYANPRFL